MNTARLFLIASIAAALTGCPGQGLNDASFATGTSALVASSDASAVFVTNPNEGSISRIDIESGEVTEGEVGVEPTRIARVGSNLVVPLRGEAAIVVLDEETMEERARIVTGAEPYGVVAREDGERFYVTVSQEGIVEEYDGESFELLRSFAVGPDVRWMALHPNDSDLYVASPYGAGLYWLNLESGVVTPVEIPTITGLSPDEDSTMVTLTPRITGDLAISPDGRQLAVPMLNVENNSPEGDLSAPNPNTVAYYAPPRGGRFNSTVLTTAVIDGGLPADEFWDAILLTASHDELGLVASYPSSVTWGPDNQQLLLTVEASDAVISVEGSHTPLSLTPGTTAQERRNAAGELVLQTRQTSVIRTSEGPRGIAFVGDEAFAYTYFDGLVENVFAERLQVGYQQTSQFGGVASSQGSSARVTDTTAWAENALTDVEREGRRLFYSATDSRMANNGAGVSCSTCHFEGRNDGLSWPLEDGARQTPSLAGGTDDTNPVTWTLSVPSAADEAFATSQGRMGGNGLSVAQSDAIGAFIQTIRPVEVSMRDLDPAAVARGEQAFADAGCDDCHSGPRMTDNESYDMLGLSNVNTPPLTGIAASAPYLHDGSAPTLRDVLVFARSGEMGDTSSLSDAEMADLETYLRSL